VRCSLVFFLGSIALLVVVSNAVMAQTPARVSPASNALKKTASNALKKTASNALKKTASNALKKTASNALKRQELRQEDHRDCTGRAVQRIVTSLKLADLDWDCMVPALAPMAHMWFCLQFPEDCEVRGIDFRRRNIALTIKRWNELDTVNSEVNREIFPQTSEDGLPTEEWLVSPPTGNCNDYAVSKRHRLLALGWPSRALLLAEVVTPSGERHLVLVVRMKDINLVLDNIDAKIWPIERVRYRWERVESPQNPRFWLMVSDEGHVRAEMARD
jgi:predicted transglutaminase-like cysteine proteinase